MNMNMNCRKRLIVVSVPAVLCLGACQSLPGDGQAMKILPADPVRHSVSRPDALYAIGRYHQGQVRYDKAIEAYTRLLADDPDHAGARNALGVILASQGRHDAAIAELEKAVENSPESASIRNNLGYAYLLQGRVDEALVVLEAATRLDPENRRARDNLDMARARSGKNPSLAQTTPPAIGKSEGAATKVVLPSPQMSQIQLVEVSPNILTLQLPGRKILPPAETASTPEKKARLEVSNGNGVTGLARKTSDHLGSSGYASIRMTNAMPYDLAATEIQYRPGFEPQARDLQTTLQPGIPMIASTTLRSDVQVRLVLGKNTKALPEVLAVAAAVLPAAMQLAALPPLQRQ
jgi:tetratricopeptide (TPR) repeat protein